MKETIRMIDTNQSECQHAKRKFGKRINFIDTNARGAFKTKSVSVLMIKCANAFNHYGVKNKVINKGMVDSECPRCDDPET